MVFGNLSIWLALISVLFAAWKFFRAFKIEHNLGKRERGEEYLKSARQGFYAMVVFIGIASIYLLYLIFTHQFQVSYVYRYSSRSLPVGLLLSTFWAGQEGSFLLWSLFIAILGIVFLQKIRRYEPFAMLIVSAVQAFFLLLLIKASPFALQPQIPPDGAGLNPLLQNFWMVIHPPLLFLGYAAATFPLALGLAALVKRDYDDWLHQALPWTLFTSVTLGAGIIIGAFWAYEVLGWGGYWGWDPVENSSLIPWITILALLHGLLVQRRVGMMKRINFFLTIVSFVLVIYATFLTRSGVLADFSVHSFQDLGINMYLILFMVLSLTTGLGILFFRFKDIPVVALNLKVLNRENILVLSLTVLLGSAIFIFLGTSSPIITNLFGKASQVNISYYNRISLPFGIGIGVLLGFAPYLHWGAPRANLFKQIWVPLSLSLLITIAVLLTGLNEIYLLLFVFFSAFTFWSNVIILIRQRRGGWKLTGAPLAHIGLGLMFMGVIISGNRAQKETIVLSNGTPASALGRQFVYRGTTPQPNGKDVVSIQVTNNGNQYFATPRFYYSEYNQAMMREPYIKSSPLQDFYIAPIQRIGNEKKDNRAELILTKGETKPYTDYQITFVDFDMPDHGRDGIFEVAAKLEIVHEGKRTITSPSIIFKQNKRDYKMVDLPRNSGNGTENPKIALRELDAGSKKILLSFEGLQNNKTEIKEDVDQIAVEVSVKPFMNVLWLGVSLLIFGTVISFARRILEHNKR